MTTNEMNPGTGKLDPGALRTIIAEVIHPQHFFVRPPGNLEWDHVPAEELSWEIFRGRLLDGNQTRQVKTFEAWNIYWVGSEGKSTEPILSVKLQQDAGKLYVTRSIHSYAWEPYDAGGNVILTREIQKWVREIVAEIDLANYTDPQRLRWVLAHRLFQAVVGLSRLPLTSIEAPLPAFTLGYLAYFHQRTVPDAPVMTSYQGLLNRVLEAERSGSEQAKLLETVLRATPAKMLADAAGQFAGRWQGIGHRAAEIPHLLLTVFDEVALSPYTDFVDNTLRFVLLLEEQGVLTSTQHADFLGALLRRIARHLTAFDLVTFHHRGANFPDALLLDAALKAYLPLADRHTEQFMGPETDQRLRRRALRQSWLLRCHYEGHLVPDTPTSPGENTRVLPPPFPHVAEEQIVNPLKRTRMLYADDPLEAHLTQSGQELLRLSIADLHDPRELQELGMALFLDRPLGVFKQPAEPDQTILFSYEAFSHSVAEQRLEMLARRQALYADVHASCLERLRKDMSLRGIKLQLCAGRVRPGVPSLQDAFRVAPDFELLRTTRRSAAEFLAQFDWDTIRLRFSADYLADDSRMLIVGGGAVGGSPETLLIYDADLQPRLELAIDGSAGYTVGDMGEYPSKGLQLLRVWQGSVERDTRSENIWIAPRT